MLVRTAHQRVNGPYYRRRARTCASAGVMTDAVRLLGVSRASDERKRRDGPHHLEIDHAPLHTIVPGRLDP